LIYAIIYPKLIEENMNADIGQNTEKKIAGRPRRPEGSVKTCITFDLDQLLWLDQFSSQIRRKSRAVLERGAIMRALVTALQHSLIDVRHDLSQVKSEDDLVRILLEKLQKD
jgi:hypothetical protein